MIDYSPECLFGVWQRIRRHPRTGRPREPAAGVDGMRAAAFEKNLSRGIGEISRMVLRTAEDGLPAHRFAPFLRIEKSKASGGTRHIHIPRLRDQIVLRALHEEIVQAAAGRGMDLRIPGVSEAMCRFRAAIEARGEAWVLRSDIRSFYDLSLIHI